MVIGRDGFVKARAFYFETLAERLPLALETPVSRVNHSGRAIRLETTRATVTAARVIVSVPTSILAAEAICFDPPLPDKLAAAAGLPLGVDDKLFISLSGNLPASSPARFSSARLGRAKR